jgi:hypothetical protein
MSHSAKPGFVGRRDRALRTLAAAQQREAAASNRFADLVDAAAGAASERGDALHAASAAAAQLSLTFADIAEAARTLRQSELLEHQSLSAHAEAGSGRSRAKLSRAQARRATAQASTNEGFCAVMRPAGRVGRRGG